MAWLRESAGAVYLRVKVQPRASRNEVGGVENDLLKLRVVTPPIGGRANVSCRDLVAAWLGVRLGAVQVTSGEHSRVKEIRVEGVTAGRVRERLARK